MKNSHFLVASLILIIFLGFELTPAHADDTNGVSIQNISVQPYSIKVGDKFTVTATLVNNSTVPIVVETGKCSSMDVQVPFFTVMFDNHAKSMAKNINCAGVGWSEILDPGKKNTSTSPDYTLNYTAIESGTANATVTFQYHVINRTDLTQPNIERTISKSFQFLIHDINETSAQKPPAYFMSPLKQFKSGIAAKDVKCKEGLQFIIKNENGQPACVTPHTFDELITRGWGILPLAGLPTYHNTSADVTIFYNGTTLSDNVVFDVKQGQNMTLMLDVVSNPANVPVTLYTAPHNGFTKTNGIDFKLSDTMVNTPAKVMLYMSVSKDATPNTYGATVKANSTDLGSVTYRFFVTVK